MRSWYERVTYQYVAVLVALSISIGAVTSMLHLPLWVSAVCGFVTGFAFPLPKKKRLARRRKTEEQL